MNAGSNIGKTDRSHWIKAATVVPTASPEEILKIVSEVTGIEVEEIKSKSRKGEVCQARHLFGFICCEHSVQSIAFLGRIVNRDHSTIVHSRNTMKRLSSNKGEEDLQLMIRTIRHRLGISNETIKDFK